MRWWQRFLLMAVALGDALPVLAQAPVPDLRFADPPGFYRSAMSPPADFSSTEVNASLQVYPFRPVNGDIRERFSRTLMRELIDPRYKDSIVAPGAIVDAISIPGSDIVLRARFREVAGGELHERMRMAVVVGTSVAILDATASSMESWQRILPRLNAFSASLQIVRGMSEPAVAAPSTSGGKAPAGVPGLYMGFVNKYDAIRRQSLLAAYYYLLSADGRVYRAYDELPVPGNDPARFDFARAQRTDPVNSGRYVLQGDQIVMHFGSPQAPETVVARSAPGKKIVIGRVEYERQ